MQAPGQPPMNSQQLQQQQVVRQAQAQAQARAQAALGSQAQPYANGVGAHAAPGLGQPRPGEPQGTATPGGSTPGKTNWTEHTAPDGRKYFYNAATKVSSWTRPAELNPQVHLLTFHAVN